MQLLIKYRIAKLIMEEQLKEMDNANPFTHSSNFNSNSRTLQRSHNLCPDETDFGGLSSTDRGDCNNPPSVFLTTFP